MATDFYQGRPYTFAFALAAMVFFVLLGLAATWHIVWVVRDWRRMQTWVETPAVIEHLEAKSNRHPRARGMRVIARYTYRFEGRDYTGERVSVFDLTDSLGPFQRADYQQLRKHEIEHRPFRCFVNQSQPSEAVLYRNLRWELLLFESIFAIGFLGVGTWKLCSIWRARPGQT